MCSKTLKVPQIDQVVYYCLTVNKQKRKKYEILKLVIYSRNYKLLMKLFYLLFRKKFDELLILLYISKRNIYDRQKKLNDKLKNDEKLKTIFNKPKYINNKQKNALYTKEFIEYTKEMINKQKYLLIKRERCRFTNETFYKRLIRYYFTIKIKAFKRKLSRIRLINFSCYYFKVKRLQPHKNEVVTSYINLLPSGRR